MATEEQKGTINISAPAQPKIGGAIASFGGWGAVGTLGAASLSLPLPISKAPNRDLAPALSLSYGSHVGNSMFGIGWHLTVNAITLRTSKGVPLYDGKDLPVGPDGEVWMPELDGKGEIIERAETVAGISYQVVRYQPRIEGDFVRIERWFTDSDRAGFWLIHGPDGSIQMYGKTLASRRAEPKDPNKPTEPERVGVWLLDESVNVRGEHMVFEYKAETEEPAPPDFRDYRAQRYLHRVLYGNAVAESELYSWNTDGWKNVDFHFHLLFDYGERSHDLTITPVYGPPYMQEGEEFGEWGGRSDPFWNHDYGFALGTRQLCRQVLMFHHFPGELSGSPKLVQRLLLEHHESPLGYNQLTAAHLQAYDRQGKVESRPPKEFNYAPFDLAGKQPGWKSFPQMPGLNDGQRYQLVDLYGKGMPGVLCRYDKAWYYRDVLRAQSGGDDVCYGELTELLSIPVADSSKALRQTLSDLNGDGKLEWGVHAPTMNGFFTLNPDRQWSTFVTYKAFPLEYFHPQAQMADLVGDGRTHLAMIGNNSVRLYTNLGEDNGFSIGRDVPHKDDALPQPRNSQTQVVGFSDVLGSGKQHLFRLSHDSLECWPNLGHGRFGKKILLSTPTFLYEAFNASRVLLADLDGSGAADLICLESDCFRVFMNQCGKGFAKQSIDIPWPEGVRYDNLCQVTIADLLGLGCSSLVLTVPHMTPQHWRYDFVHAKPYLIDSSNNNMGARSCIEYRSSAQELLDEEFEQHQIDKDKVFESEVPFAMHLVKRQTRFDEITRNRLTQVMSYRQGYYDPIEREFRGFGLVMQIDTEATEAERSTLGFTAPSLSKTWFHTGKSIDQPRDGYYPGDTEAIALLPTKLEQFHRRDKAAEPVGPQDEETSREIARALSGVELRTEVFAADKPEVPYAVKENRYQVRILRAKGLHYPYTVLQPMALESISYQYEPELPDDPRCEHTLNLRWDEFGSVLHAFIVYYARRRTAETPPFDDEHESRYWTDAHDESQQRWYLTESKAEYIDIYDEDAWKPGVRYRLGLPYRERTNALVLEKGQLSSKDIHHAKFLEWSTDDGEWAKKAVLASMSMQYYIDPDTGQTMDKGSATYHALPGYVKIAELDATALSAYDKLKDENGNMPFNLKEKLEEVGYHIMEWFLPEVELSEPEGPTDAKNYLWSVHRGFAHYLGLEDFYNVDFFQQTQSHGITKVTNDPYGCLHTAIELPDGCITQTLNTDYCTFLPASIEDPNRNTRQACYNAFGEGLVTSFFGTELGVEVGFDPLDDYVRPDDRSPAHAIESPLEAIGNYAMAMFSDAFSWMGRVPTDTQPSDEWLAWARAEGFVLPSGHLCDRARQHLRELEDPNEFERLLQQYIEAAHREPVHVATLQADRYPGDPELQIRIAIIHQDGFGRVLQSKQEVERGKAWVVKPDGTLKLKEDGTPEEAEATRRWRVSEPVEYNNKGQTVRIYRPYFADQFRRINDESLRQFAYHDQQFYDAAGRPTQTVLAKKMPQGENSELKPLRREQCYRCWYDLFFDENDLFDPTPPVKTRNGWTLH
ncbi:SpvB/TcaC N-terminal domain-containing protein [Pseudomonas sp. P8_241]|uniref:SpvB/TcaC N-terminal domain-containing protein n=1 Tax=Pseudomonas sp. P8_241 TaxID=3043445 RepID=UPI002A36A0FC|nr:SpvB/TcaC N-terminal domain-containing protein [Pseudomonas sp. P8_241]WPN46204.1 SpvB/TcaC N-terminal domain-containing protein [Pseudomonas sp. P8_241]